MGRWITTEVPPAPRPSSRWLDVCQCKTDSSSSRCCSWNIFLKCVTWCLRRERGHVVGWKWWSMTCKDSDWYTFLSCYNLYHDIEADIIVRPSKLSQRLSWKARGGLHCNISTRPLEYCTIKWTCFVVMFSLFYVALLLYWLPYPWKYLYPLKSWLCVT